MKNLFLVSQTKNNDYDSFDSFVVCAETLEAARLIHPRGAYSWSEETNDWKNREYDSPCFIIGEWCNPKYVEVKLIGTASDDIKIGEIICSSFNAG